MSSPALTSLRTLDLKGVTLGMGAPTPQERAAGMAVAGLERAFPAGLPASLHVLEAKTAKDAASVSAVALALVRHTAPRQSQRTVVWITQGLAATEGGRPYGPGLLEQGHDPARFLFVEARRPVDALWAMEECLRSRAVSAVVAELYDRKTLDLTATRRLALRSERAEAPAFIVSQCTLGEAALAARSRWQVAAAPSRGASDHDALIGAPSFHVEIIKNRDGPCPRLTLALDLESGAFRELAVRSRRLPHPAPTAMREDNAQALIAPAVVRLAAERRQRAEAARVRS